jgi:hypothetical protein
MAKKKEAPELSKLQKEQRRRAAAAPHAELCTCPQCFYRARRAALEDGGASFSTIVDWRAAQELERAARVQVPGDAGDVDTTGVKEYIPSKPNTRVVTELGKGKRIFIAGGAPVNGNTNQQDQDARAAEANLAAVELPPDIITFTTSPDYLGLEISVPQGALLKASYGLELTEEEMVHFRQCTGRTIDPRINFTTVVVIAGARAGKDSRLVGPTALYEAVLGGHKISKGETATIGLYAQGKEAAAVTFDYISKYATESPKLADMVKGQPLRSKLTLDNSFVIRTFPATRIAGRAYSFPVAVLNESAFYRFEGAANADTEILTSVRRGMLNFPKRKLLIVSTPYAKQGILYDHFVKFYGRDDSKDVLVWRAHVHESQHHARAPRGRAAGHGAQSLRPRVPGRVHRRRRGLAAE